MKERMNNCISHDFIRILDGFIIIPMRSQVLKERNQGRPPMSTAGRLLAHPMIDSFFITPT